MRTYSFNKILLLIILVAGAFSQFACKKNNSGAPPVISRLRASTPAPNDSALTLAGPGQTVVIQGSNLATAAEIYFNGYPAPFNSALLSNENIVVTIPADMPFASLNPADLNTVKVVTRFGETVFTFPIVPPPAVITAMSNEYAQAGLRVTIYGNNFFFVDKVVFPGNIAVTTNLSANTSGTTLEVTVPPGITASGPISVVNRYGTAVSVLRFNDFVTGVMHNGDNISNFSWGCETSSDAAAYPGAWGSFNRLVFTGVNGGDFGWWNWNRSINTNGSQWVPAANLDDPIGNYALKFELFVKEDWESGRLYITKDYNWTYLANYAPWKLANGSNIKFNTGGKWQTVVIPLTAFKTKANGIDGTGDPAPSLKALLGTSGFGNIDIMFINPDVNAVASFNAAIDNIRVVKIK